VQLLVIGIACAGKTKVSRHLRACSDLNVVDMDDAIGRLNGGVYPDIPTKNNVVLPKVFAEVCALPDVVLFASLNVEQTRQLRESGFSTVLLDVSAEELRRRHAVRLAEEGWTNVQWFDHEQAVMRDLRDNDLFDHVVSGEESVATVAEAISRLAEDRRT
jgi:hypothetical protein